MEFNPKTFEDIVNELKEMVEEEFIEQDFDEFMRRRVKHEK